MDENMQARMDSYLELFEQLKEKTGTETVALALLQELARTEEQTRCGSKKKPRITNLRLKNRKSSWMTWE